MNRPALQDRPLDWRAVCELAAAGRFDWHGPDDEREASALASGFPVRV